MKYALACGTIALTLSGCTSSACDTGDSACKTGTGTGTGTPFIEGIYYDCSDGVTCVWTVEASGGSLGTVELDLAETGDPTATCGPTSAAKDLSECGFWTEYHNGFSLVDSGGGLEAKAITLDIVSSFDDQVQNQSTIMDMGDQDVHDQITVMATVTDSAGNYADCWVYGDRPNWFSSCPNASDATTW